MFLKGFGFSGYRSFGNELVKISPLKKVNMIIGKNNVGKSNIINFIANQYKFFVSKAENQKIFGSQPKVPFIDIDYHLSKNAVDHKIAFSLTEEELTKYIDTKLPNTGAHRRARESARKLLTSSVFTDSNNVVWFVYKSTNVNTQFQLDIENKDLIPLLEHDEWRLLWFALTGSSGGSLKEHWAPEAIKKLSFIPSVIPNIEVIPAIRKIGVAGSKAIDFSGEGIIERLAKIQNPPFSDQGLKEKFNAINKFVQDVLETSDATIEIPYERDMILIHMDQKTLPLESLGTGVHEVVILAAASTLLDNTIVCIEEPELHIHPLLQKKLIKYLSEETNNQYFLTTHSAHLLDAVEAEIFHVTLNNGVSEVKAISSTKQRSIICNDLGYKASDILQANCIIWVEGPSDRIYLNYWIKYQKPNLIEGIHYSIMFYGGRLFSHLTAIDDDESLEKINDFISLRNLNRNTIIIFDSDKSSSRSRITATKQRLKQEFNDGSGFAWVTKGREIENYLDEEKVKESVLSVHPSADRILNTGQWANLLQYTKKRSKKPVAANKVKVARHYIENNDPDLSFLDLEERIELLCKFIIEINE